MEAQSALLGKPREEASKHHESRLGYAPVLDVLIQYYCFFSSRILTFELYNGVMYSDCEIESDSESESYKVTVSAHTSPINQPADMLQLWVQIPPDCLRKKANFIGFVFFYVLLCPLSN